MAPALRRQLAAFFDANALGIAAVYLFGSMAREEATDISDVDVAVLFETSPMPALMNVVSRLEDELEQLLGRPVDVVNLNQAPADLVHRVLRDGIILTDRNRSKRLQFEVARRNEYFDLEFVRRRYRNHDAAPLAAQ